MNLFNFRIDNDKFIVYLQTPGSEVDYNTIDEMTELIDAGMEKGFQKIYFDLQNLEFIDSSGLGKLITATKKAKIILLNTNVNVKRLLQLTNVIRYFTLE